MSSPLLRLASQYQQKRVAVVSSSPELAPQWPECPTMSSASEEIEYLRKFMSFLDRDEAALQRRIKTVERMIAGNRAYHSRLEARLASALATEERKKRKEEGLTDEQFALRYPVARCLSLDHKEEEEDDDDDDEDEEEKKTVTPLGSSFTSTTTTTYSLQPFTPPIEATIVAKWYTRVGGLYRFREGFVQVASYCDGVLRVEKNISLHSTPLHPIVHVCHDFSEHQKAYFFKTLESWFAGVDPVTAHDFIFVSHCNSSPVDDEVVVVDVNTGDGKKKKPVSRWDGLTINGVLAVGDDDGKKEKKLDNDDDAAQRMRNLSLDKNWDWLGL